MNIQSQNVHTQRGSQQHNNHQAYDTRQRFSPYSPRGVESYSAIAGQSLLSDDQKRTFKIKFPMEPRDVVIHLNKFLHDFEKTEILEYDQVYYLNILERKNSGKPLATPDGPENGGYDNDKGEYLCDVHDHIAYRFEVQKRIGKGSFGQVFKCYDHKKNETVALKILRNKKRLYKQGLIEAGILEKLRIGDPEDKKNIVRIIETLVFRKHLILSFEMLSMNLYEFIKMNNF